MMRINEWLRLGAEYYDLSLYRTEWHDASLLFGKHLTTHQAC